MGTCLNHGMGLRYGWAAAVAHSQCPVRHLLVPGSGEPSTPPFFSSRSTGSRVGPTTKVDISPRYVVGVRNEEWATMRCGAGSARRELRAQGLPRDLHAVVTGKMPA